MQLPGGAETLRLLVESLHGFALAVLDPEGRVAFWDEDAERLTGWVSDEVVGKTLDEIFAPAAPGRPTTAEVLAEARERGTARAEQWRSRKGGARFFADESVSALHDEGGALLGFAVLVRDETERKRNADRQRFLAESGAVLAESLDLRESFDRVAHLAVPEIADWALVDVLQDGELVRVAVAHGGTAFERQAHALLRRVPGASPKSEPRLFEVVATGVPQLLTEVPQANLERFARDEQQLAVVRKLGFRSWMCVPLSAHGRVLGALSFLMAGSGRVFDESDLAFAVEVGERAGATLANARLYDDARRALKAREEFLAVASHELRTPLTPLRLQLDALSRVLCSDQRDATRQRHKIEVMRRQVDRLARLVESLLAVTRGSPIELIARAPADLVEIVGDVVERLQERAYSADTQILFEPQQAVRGRFDARALEIVVEHLLDNALKYGDGAPVEVTVERGDGHAVLRVRDRGIGIEEADQERIFEKFERSVSSDHYGGLGLGLFIAKELVHAHGGALRVESERGHGAVFSVELPIEDPRGQGELVDGRTP